MCGIMKLQWKFVWIIGFYFQFSFFKTLRSKTPFNNFFVCPASKIVCFSQVCTMHSYWSLRVKNLILIQWKLNLKYIWNECIYFISWYMYIPEIDAEGFASSQHQFYDLQDRCSYFNCINGVSFVWCTLFIICCFSLI